MPQLYANNASALLAISITDVDVQLSVAAGFGDLFPDPNNGIGEFFIISLNNAAGEQEICECTQRINDTLFITRGHEGTIPVAFVSGSRVECRITAGTMDQYFQNDANVDFNGNDVIGIGNLGTVTITLGGTAITATADEINLLSGATAGSILPSGTALVFYQAAAPTGWTQKVDADITNLDGSTLRIVEGAGGGVVAGTHGLDAPPNIDHSHTDTFSTQSVSPGLPPHSHNMFYDVESTSGGTNRPEANDSVYVSWSGQSSNDQYTMKEAGLASSFPPTVALTSTEGTGSSHSHSVNGSVSSAALTAFAPKYVDVILCTKD